MKVTQIIQGVSAASGGPSYLVARLGEELQRSGDPTVIYALGRRPSDWPYEVRFEGFGGGIKSRLGMSPELATGLRKISRDPCILHGHGIWRAINLFPLLIRGNAPCRMIWSVHGALSSWSMRAKRRRKLAFWRALQKPALERVHCFHATRAAEYEDIRRAGLRAPVAILPSGIDTPAFDGTPRKTKRIVFMSRLHPVKGLDLLLPAWKTLARRFPEWELVIAGPAHGDYGHSIRRLAAELQLERVEFVGEVSGREKTALLSEAGLFVLPSYSENFGVVVAEALAHGTPVVTTTATPWRELVSRDCGWWVAAEAEPLAAALSEALSLPQSRLTAMGREGRHWMRESLAWPMIASQMHTTYEWLLHGGSRPAWVVED